MENEAQRTQEHEGFEIDLIELLYRFLEKARYIILAAVLGALLMALYTYLLVTPTYQSRSKLYISNSKDSVINLSDLQMNSNRAQDYVEVFSAHDVPELVLRRLKAEYPGKYDKYTTYQQIQRMVSVSGKAGTRLLYITVTSTDKTEAMQIANMYLDVALNGEKNGTYGKINEKIGTNGLQFEEAVVASKPHSPNKVRNIVIGLLAGLVVALAVITVQFIVDDRVRNVEQLEKRLGLPVLGMMPATDSDAPSHSDSAHSSTRSPRSGKARKASKGGKK